MDLLMIGSLIVGFKLLFWLIKWCDKQINKER